MKKLFICTLAILSLSACSEVELFSHAVKTSREPAVGSTIQQGTFKVGKTYTVLGQTYTPRETYNFTETGIASWYGPGFHKGRTASGEVYDKYEMTAAHRTLQMPSLVRVTNLDNGRSVIVRVNDRGPFKRGRVIDVSKRAAEMLGMIGTGTAKVRIDLLPVESRIIAEAAKTGMSTKGAEVAMNETGRLPDNIVRAGGGAVQPVSIQTAAANVPGHVSGGNFYPDPVVTQMPVTPSQIYVQVGAFGSQDNAQKLVGRLSNFGQAIVQPADFGGRTVYRVRLGPLDSVNSADNVLSRVIAAGHNDAIITVQ